MTFTKVSYIYITQKNNQYPSFLRKNWFINTNPIVFEKKVWDFLCHVIFIRIFVKKHMGTYINTFKKKFNKKAILDGQEVIVGQATFLCRQDWSGTYTPSESREMNRAYALTENDQPDYITFEGETVYKNNKRGVWSDGSGFWSGIDPEKDFVGILKKVGKKFVIEK